MNIARCKQAELGVAGNGNSGDASPEHHEDALSRLSATSRIGQEPHGGLRNPAGALASGRGFTIDTGVKVSEETTCEGACSGKVKITERYIATFTRRP